MPAFANRCYRFVKSTIYSTLSVMLLTSAAVSALAQDLSRQIQSDYDAHLGVLFDHFHRNPELSLLEHQTAARMAQELTSAGFTVTEGVGGTGVVAVFKNGPGPMVMMRADMDGLPVLEKSLSHSHILRVR